MDPIFLLMLALAAFGIVFFGLWLTAVTCPRGRHHDHLIPTTPRSCRSVA